ncbi:MAG: hypothetical protein WDN23_07045 [Edaphobacter sp.]
MFDPDVAYAPAQWSTFLSTEAGAAAALTGLLFVAVSINLQRIITYPQLTPRIIKALATLMGILFATSLCLVPGQSNKLLGIELITFGIFLWLIITLKQRAHSRGNPYLRGYQKFLYSLMAQMSALPIIVCGASLLSARGGGLYWLVPAVIVSFASAVLDAWVLLIEIQR